jgi:hypothetical protein
VSALLLLGSLAACSDMPSAPDVEARPGAGEITETLSTSTSVVVSDLKAASGRSYVAVTGGLAAGKPVYTDRTFTWETFPATLAGLTYIRTSMNDKGVSSDPDFLSFRIDREATVYVAYAGTAPPAWLANNFTATGQTVVMRKSLGRVTFNLYAKTFPAGVVAVGANLPGDGVDDMYAVILAASGSATSVEAPQPTGFSAVVAGIRPRGFGKGTYTLVQPASGRKMYYVSTGGSDSNPGSSSAPFRTINRAAQVAVAGDVVTIRGGTYRESVKVRYAGTASQPITFQAEQRGQVVLTGGQYHFVPANWNGGPLQKGATHVTLRGLVFRSYAPEVSDPRVKAAVGAIRGWKIEDSLFDDAGYSGLDIRGDSVTVTRSTFQYHHTYALTGSGDASVPHLRGINITDIVMRGNNTRSDPLEGTAAGKVVKFWYTRDVVVDNIESYDNNGPGWWFDCENYNYTVRNSYLHHNKTTSGRGLLLEKNRAPGLVENNVFAYNVGSGMGIFNSEGITVRGNLFEGDGRSIYVINRDWGGKWVLRNLNFQANFFNGWAAPSAIHAMSDGIKAPSLMGIVADGNTYEKSANQVLATWGSAGQITTLSDLRTKLGWEKNGGVGSIVSPL